MKVYDEAVRQFTKLHPNKVFDLSFLDAIFAIIDDLLGSFANCGIDSDDAHEMIESPTRRQKRRLRWRIRRSLGRKDYRSHGAEVYTALINTGKNLTRADMREAYDG